MSAESEVTGNSEHTVTWRDLTLTFSDDAQDWSVDAIEAFEQGKSVTALRELLGEKQWGEVRKLKPKGRDVADLMDVIAQAAGFTDSPE